MCLTGGEACFGGVWGEGLVWQDQRGGGGGGVRAGEGPVGGAPAVHHGYGERLDRKSTRLNSSH